MKKLTIGMPVYNGAATIRAAFESLLAQTFTDFDLVVSDNASTDDTQAISEEYARRDPRVRYIRQPVNLGPAMNFRFALFEARTPYFMWAAADDLWKPEFAASNIEALEADPGLVLSVSQVLFAVAGVPCNLATGTYPLGGDFPNNIACFFRNPADNSRYYGVFRTEALQAVFPSRPFYALDWAVSAATLKHGRHHEVPEVLMVRDSSDPAAYANAVARDHRRLILQIFPLLFMTQWLVRNGYVPMRLSVLRYLLKLNLYIHFRFGVYHLDRISERYLASNSLWRALGLPVPTGLFAPDLKGRLKRRMFALCHPLWRALPLTLSQRQRIKAATHRRLAPFVEDLPAFSGWTTGAAAEAIALPSDSQADPAAMLSGEPRFAVVVVGDAGPEACRRTVAAAVAMGQRTTVEIVVAVAGAGFFDAPGGAPAGARLVEAERGSAVGSLLNAGIAVTTAPRLILLRAGAWFEPTLADDLGEALHEAALVAPQLVYADGRLAAAGGVISARSAVWPYGRFAQPADPRFTFARACDFAPGALALRRDVLNAADPFDARFVNFDIAVSEFCLRHRPRCGHPLYWPFAKVAIPLELMRPDGLDTVTPENWIEDWSLLAQLYEATLRDDAALTADGAAEHDRTRRLRLLYVDADTPTPDQNAGSIECFNLLRIFGDFGFRVTFIPESNFVHRSGYSATLQKIGVECIHYPFAATVSDVLNAHNGAFDVVVLCRAYIAARYAALVRQRAPRARIIFNTVDLHFLREGREAELGSNPTAVAAAARTKQNELNSIRSVDLTIVLSTYEHDLLAREVPEARVHVVPLVREIPPVLDTPGPRDRRDIVFIGTYQHPPNQDAAIFFARQIWPVVRRSLPDARFLVVGSAVTPAVEALAGDGVEVLGFVQDLDALMRRVRVAVAPIRFGAGLKGKVATTLQAGLPTVATTIAAEGMALSHRREVLIADEPEEIASSVVRLYTDDALWNDLSQAGFAFVRDEFSIAANLSRIAFALDAVGVLPNAARTHLPAAPAAEEAAAMATL